MNDNDYGIDASDMAGDWIDDGEYQEWLELQCLDEMDRNQQPPEWLELSATDNDPDQPPY